MMNVPDVLLHSLLVVVIGWIGLQCSVRWLALYILNWTKSRLRRKKREEAFIPNANNFSTCDVLPSNGINALIRHTWNFFLEPYLAAEGLLILQGVLEGSIEENKKIEPNSVIEWCQIKELTWGTSPPKLSNIALQLLFPERCLKISFTLELSSTDLHCLIDVLLRVLPNVPTVKCQVTANKLYLLANISFAFHLCNETPGFADFEVWFEEKPTLDLKLLPLGLPISDITLVSDWLNTSLENVIELSMVHERVVASMFDVYNRMKVLQEKRIIRIIVHKPLLGKAKPRKPKPKTKEDKEKEAKKAGKKGGTAAGGSTAGAGGSQVPQRTSDNHVRRYCKVKFGSRYKRTYVYDDTNTGQWTCLLDFSLHDYPIKCEELVTISLMEYEAEAAEPECVAEASVLVSIQGGQNPVLGDEVKNAAKISVNYNEKARSCVAPFNGDKKSMSVVRLTVSTLSSSSTGGFQSNLHRIQSWQPLNQAKKDVQTINSILLKSMRWVFRPLFTFLHLKEDSAQPTYSENHKHLMYRSTNQLISIKKEFDREKKDLEELLAERNVKLDLMRQELEMEKRRRVNQDLRALSEGAKFFFKNAESKRKATLYHIWHSSSERQINMGQSKHYKPSKTLALDDVQHVRSVIYMNPSPESQELEEKKKKKKKENNRARSQFLIDMKDGDCYRLEIPPGGNGRSREEWMQAFKSVVSGARIY
ncbi:hypothetical protein HOP50_03g19750 [Chloropicon primus]|uniref:Uncharacterized protein n=1 Tax=Chloropicon primus TaxID=1764295 RepID=A0A5B8MGB4_9CHLO|nr:hypothetical protein A3770_03p19770 [Chloropicon primus]UPQ98669.1 hypothetical protein HOP50_03g19750 [Chloropicon primus]|eukprot:QDZ19459.1 hypothetical protein A3770_03p19770 [Chloropicon primus]